MDDRLTQPDPATSFWTPSGGRCGLRRHQGGRADPVPNRPLRGLRGDTARTAGAASLRLCGTTDIGIALGLTETSPNVEQPNAVGSVDIVLSGSARFGRTDPCDRVASVGIGAGVPIITPCWAGSPTALPSILQIFPSTIGAVTTVPHLRAGLPQGRRSIDSTTCPTSPRSAALYAAAVIQQPVGLP